MALTLIHGEAGLDHEQAKRDAWAIVADAYRAALAVPGLLDEDRAPLRTVLRHSDHLAGRRHLTAIRGDA
jgi:hypothetical protein